MAQIDYQGVGKTYSNYIVALAEIDLTVADGELLVLVGPSGCGKSTLLRLLAGLETPSYGTIRIGGQDVAGISPQARNVAMVFQDYALYPTMTVRGNLEFPLQMRKLPAQEITRRVQWAGELLEIGALLDRYPRELSGGQRQRVAMGRALVREPAAFLLDEPLSNLDAKLRVQVRAEIGQLQKRMGATMLYVTHDQVEAMTLGDRVAVLDGGRLQQIAVPQALYEHPANAFVAGFIGNPPMNLFAAELQPAPRGWQLTIGTTALPAAPANLDPQTFPAHPQPVTAGVRPEALRLARDGEPGLPAEVVALEYLGHETLLHAHLTAAPLQTLTARLPGIQHLRIGDQVRVTAPPERFYVYAAATTLGAAPHG